MAADPYQMRYPLCGLALGAMITGACLIFSPFPWWTWLMWVGVVLATFTAASIIFDLVNRQLARRTPKPPEDVRVVTRDGKEIAVQCIYAGYVDGAHEWEMIRPYGVAGEYDVAELRIGLLPGRTRIRSWEST